MIRLVGGLGKGAPTCLFFLLCGQEDSLAVHPCSRGRANGRFISGQGGREDRDSIPLLTSFVRRPSGSTKFLGDEEGGDGDMIRLLNGHCKGAPAAFSYFFFFVGGGPFGFLPFFVGREALFFGGRT